MVPDDIYKEDVDFAALAMQHAGFAKKLKSNGQLDFSDPESVRQLTKALLQRDFGLSIELPENRLCPPVPNRFNYIVFIRKLVESTRPHFRADEAETGDEKILALDIGTGAAAIYPLLGCRRPNWYFLASELDDESREYALKNVRLNNLQSRIKIVKPDENLDEHGNTTYKILPTSQVSHLDRNNIAIQICNPPFYASQDEMRESARLKSRPPNSACTGAPIEMITPGGEISFITRLIHESARPENNAIQWFSSMLGKLSSLPVLTSEVKKVTANYAVTEFIQGSKTRRWCIAWSFAPYRPPTELARGIPGLEKKILPFPSDFDFPVDGSSTTTTSIHGVSVGAVQSEVAKLNLDWVNSDDGGIGRSKGDVWSRKARRHGKEKMDTRLDDSSDPEAGDFAFRVSVEATDTVTKSVSSTTTVKVRWLQGYDAVLFESFCGWLKRKVQSHYLESQNRNDGS